MCRLGILPFTSIYIRSPMSCLDTGLLFQEPPDRLLTLTTTDLGETPAWRASQSNTDVWNALPASISGTATSAHPWIPCARPIPASLCRVVRPTRRDG